MTDSSALLANSLAVSDQVLYSLKPSSARGRNYRASVAPINASTFNPNTQCIFSIPCGRRNTYLDVNQSFIKFTVKNNDVSGNNFWTDNNAACFINRVDIFHGGNLLESIQNYNQIMTYILDFSTNPAQRVGLANMYGMATATNDLALSRQGMYLAGGQSATFCIPILSALIGLGADKACPTGFLSDDIRVEITWEQQTTAVCYAATPTGSSWQVTFAELELTYIELQDEAQHLVDEITPAHHGIYLHGNTWRSYVSQLPASTTGTFSTLVPARMCSIKSLICLSRRTTEVSSATSYSLSSRVNPQIANYWWRCGSVLMPARYVTLWNPQTTSNFSEAFAELQKNFHSLTNPDYAGSIPFTQYNVVDANTDVTVGGNTTTGGVVALSTGVNSYKNGFAIATEVETFAQKSNLLISGLNTLNSNIFFEANIGIGAGSALGGNGVANTYAAITGPATAYNLNFFANFDIIFAIENGILTARF